MKKLISMFLLVATVLSLCACTAAGGGEEKAPAGLQVGFAREKAMPPTNTVPELDGTAADRMMTTYVDNLTVTCVAIKGSNDETVLLYTMDRKNSAEDWLAPIRKNISDAVGVPEDHIMMAATHTHSAPKLAGWTGADRYVETLKAALLKVAQDALADLSPAETYIGSTQTEGLVFVRQYRLKDGTVTSSGVSKGSPLIEDHAAESDQELQVVRFAREEGKKDVILMSFNAHATFYGGVTGTVMSADYPSPAREYVESQGDYLVAFFAGDAGNQAPTSKYIPDLAIEAKDYKEHGQRLGQYVLDTLETMEKAEGTEVTLVEQQYTAKSNKERLDMMSQAAEVIALYRTEGRDAANALAAKYGLYQTHEASAILDRAEMPDTNDVRMNVMAIGNDLSFAFAPYEMFSESGSYIRANTPYKMTFLSSCTNGAEGYLPSKAACDYGCYEYYITKFEVGTAELLADEYLKMLTEMKNS